MLEVFKPATPHLIDLLDDLLQALAIRAPGLVTDRILVLLQTLLAWPMTASLEVVPKEVESTRLGGVYDPRLVAMELQTGCRRPLLHFRQRPFGFSSTPTQHNEVIGIAHHLVPPLGHIVVERV